MPSRTTVVLGGRYELGEQLGRGGMARVFAASDRVLDRRVAVKILAEPFDRDAGFVARFRREAQAAARLNHPNIVSVFDSGSDGGRHFIVTELVDGETLSSLLARTGRLPPERSVEIGSEVARALGAAHAAGIVHRDVKPGNVMLGPDGSAKVLDFGIAQAAGDEAITRSGWVLGSASYVSPEQARGERADERTDLYALGCVLYAMLAGRPPFVADSPLATLYRHVHDEPEPPSRFAPTVPTSLESIVLRCLAKRRDERFASAIDLERALGDLESPGGTLPLPVATDDPERAETRPIAAATAPPRRGNRRRVLAALAAAAVIGLAALAVARLDDPGLGRAGAPTLDGSDAERSPGADDGEPTPSVSTAAPDDVTGAIAALMESVDGAVLSGAFADEKDAEKFRDRLLKVAEFSGNGDVEHAVAEASRLDDELARLVDQGRLSPDAGADIGAALDDVLAAMEVDAGAGGEPEGPGNGHGNAFGHEDGDD